MNRQQLEELTDHWRNGCLTEGQASELNQALRGSEEARRYFRAEAQLHGLLHCAAAAAAVAEAGAHLSPQPVRTDTTALRSSNWLSWRPLAAAAAGIVLGMFCTSLVFAYVAPSLGKAMSLLQESFESGPAPLVTGVPIEAGRWSGDYTEVVGEQQGVKPTGGNKMMRFLRADFEGKENADGYVADLYQLIDLRPYRSEFADGGAVLQFSAGFNASAFPADESYGGLMSIHALDAETVKTETLGDRQMLNVDALAMAGSSRLMLDRDPATWQRQATDLRLPLNTDFLLIHVGVTHATKAQRRAVFDGHYLDDVRLVLTRRAPLP